MTELLFTPPVVLDHVISKSEGPEGHVSSINLLLSDASHRLFCLHVSTDANFGASFTEFVDPHPEFPEPVFVVPSISITEAVIEDIIGGVDPELLNLYLIPQDTQKEAAAE